MTDPQNPYGQTEPPAPAGPPSYAAPPAGPPAYNAAPGYAAAPPPAYGAPVAPVIPGKTLGIVALIVAFFANIIGLILGIVALVQSKKAGYKNTPAVWAIIVGAVLAVIGIIVGIILLVVVIGGLAAACAELGPGVHQLTNGGTITCGS